MVSLAQLFALGFSRGDVRGMLSQGRLHQLYPGVYAIGHTNLIPHARLIAALLTCGPTSFLSHRSAAAVWGLREINSRRIEVSVPGSNLRPRRGLVVHRVAPPDEADLAIRNGLRVSSVPRLLIEVAAHEKPHEVDRLVTQAVRKRILDLEATERALARHARRPGVANTKRALRAYRPWRDHKSGLERVFAKLIAGTDIPEPQHNVTIDGWEIDFYWPHVRLAVELDGRPYHIAARDMEKDRFKDGQLLLKAIRTLRVTDLRMALEPQRVLKDVRALTT